MSGSNYNENENDEVEDVNDEKKSELDNNEAEKEDVAPKGVKKESDVRPENSDYHRYVKINVNANINNSNPNASANTKDNRNSVDTSIMEENTDIVVKVVPILQQIGSDAKLSQYIDEYLSGNDHKLELLKLLAIAKDQQSNIYGINDALLVIRNMETNGLLKALEIEATNCEQRKEIFEHLKNEIADMKNALKLAQNEHSEFEKQILEIEQKKDDEPIEQRNRGLFERLFFGPGIEKVPNIAAIATSSTNLNATTTEMKIRAHTNVDNQLQLGELEIVSSEGMLGNMLLALVGDVGKEMNSLLTPGKLPRVNTVEFVNYWKEFPENVRTYLPILQRVSKLGVLAFHAFVKSIIDSDEEQKSPSNVKSTSFRLEYLKQHISQHLNNPIVRELCNYIMDFIMADILASVLYISDPDLLSRKRKRMGGIKGNLHEDLIQKWISKLPILNRPNLGEALGQELEQRRSRKWGILISIITPRFAAEVVSALQKSYDSATTEEQRLGIINGARYVHFDLNCLSAIESQLNWLNSLLTKSKDGQNRQQLCLRAIEHSIRSLPTDQRLEKLLFNTCLKETREKLNELGKNLEYLASVRSRLQNTELLRGGQSMNMSLWLDQCIDFKFSNKRVSPRYLADLLHLLRGGGSTWDQFILQLVRPKTDTNSDSNSSVVYMTIDRLEQAYGNAEYKFSPELCRKIGEKIFRSARTYNAKNAIEAEIIHLLCLCMVQMAVHNFFHISQAIKEFIETRKNDTIERVFIAVYALNFICVPEAMFREHLLKKSDNAKQLNESLDKFKNELRGTLESLFGQIGKYIPLTKHLLSLSDAVAELSATSVLIQDEQQMFNSHVTKLLLLDWSNGISGNNTEWSMEQILPIFNDIQLDVLTYCLRLAPHINCDSLWSVSAQNCSLNGKFIGKWLLHRDVNVRMQVLRTLIRSMKNSQIRQEIMQCFVEMLSHNDYQSRECLCMLLKTVTYLLDIYKKEMMVNDAPAKTKEIQKPIGIRRIASVNQQDAENNRNRDNSTIRRKQQTPEWWKWFPRADGCGLGLLCHYDAYVRYFAYQYIMKLSEVHYALRRQTDIASFYKSMNFSNLKPNQPRVKVTVQNVDKTIGGLIQIHGRTITRMALMQANQEKSPRHTISVISNQNLERSLSMDSNLYNELNSGEMANKRTTVTSLISATRQKELPFDTVIRMDGLVPSLTSQLAKKMVDLQMHETIATACNFIHTILGEMPPANTKGKTGWSSSEEWKDKSPTRTHWKNLHTLLFSLVGEGIPNPFSGMTDDSKMQDGKEAIPLGSGHQLPGFRGTGGELFEATKQKFEKYLCQHFWSCLHEENQWPREVIALVLEKMHWEAIPSVMTTMIQVFNETQGRRRTRMIEDLVYLLKQLGEVKHFSAGIYHGDKDLVKRMFDLIDTLRAEAFRSDRTEKSRWFETQRDLAEAYALFLRGLSRIGAHPLIRQVFWHFPNEGLSKEEIENNVRNFRKRLRFNKKSIMQTRRVEYDKLPHVNQTNEEMRFQMFMWLLKFFHDTEKAANALHFEDHDYASATERNKIVSNAVFTALQYLLNMGRVFPSKYLGIEEKAGKAKSRSKQQTNLLRSQDNYVVNFLRGGSNAPAELKKELGEAANQQTVLDLFVKAERAHFEVLTPFLLFQFEQLFSFYIEKAIESHVDEKDTLYCSHSYFLRAIVAVMEINSSGERLTVVESKYRLNDWKIQRPVGDGFLSNVFHYAHRLLFLGLMMIVEPDNDTRFSGFLLLRALAHLLIGKSLVNEIEKYKFAFESSMSLWVRKNGTYISRLFAKYYPSIGSALFRDAIKYTESSQRREWITTFLKPWARMIHLHCANKSNMDEKYLNYYSRKVGHSAHSSVESMEVPSMEQAEQEHSTSNIKPTITDIESTNVMESINMAESLDTEEPGREDDESEEEEEEQDEEEADGPVVVLIKSSASKISDVVEAKLDENETQERWASINLSPKGIVNNNNANANTNVNVNVNVNVNINGNGIEKPKKRRKDAEYYQELNAERNEDADKLKLRGHETLLLLSNLFHITTTATDQFQTSLLKVWKELASSYRYENLFAILDFLMETVEASMAQAQKQQTNLYTQIIPACKNIIFAIYGGHLDKSNSKNNSTVVKQSQILTRRLMTFYIVRVLLKVLTIGMNEYTKTSLKIRHRSAEILTRYQERMSEEEKAQGKHDKESNEYRLDYGYDAQMSGGSDDSASSSRHQRSGTKLVQPMLISGATGSGGSISVPMDRSVSTPTSPNTTTISLSDNNSATSAVVMSRGQVERKADLAAALLVDIIGVDSRPIVPFYPVLVLYASLFLTFSSNPRQLHHLLVRMMSTLCLAKDFDNLQNEQISYEEASVATALKSRNLQLMWDDDAGLGDATTRQQFTVDDGVGTVVMDGGVFIDKYCRVLKPELNAQDRIGYEALRWAVLSTNQDLAQRAFHVYRQLLNPLNHAAVKVVLLILVGSIDQWENTSKYQRIKESVPKEYYECMRILDTLLKMAHALRQKQQLHEHPALFWAGIALMRANVRNEHENQLFHKGLELISMTLDPTQNLQYFIDTVVWSTLSRQQSNTLQKNNSNRPDPKIDASKEIINIASTGQKKLDNNNKDPNESDSDNDNDNDNEEDEQVVHINMNTQPRLTTGAHSENKGGDLPIRGIEISFIREVSTSDFIGTTYVTPMEEDMTGHLAYHNEDSMNRDDEMEMELQMEAAERNGLPEKFWNYCEEWTPRFEGVQQYLLQGFLKPQHEDMCFKMIKDALVSKMDNIMDRTNLRPLLALIAVLPYVCYHSRHSPEKLTELPSLFHRLGDVFSSFSNKLCFKLQEYMKGITDDDIFLKEICPIIVEQFFGSYAKVVANYFEGLLEAPGMGHYHSTIFKITRYFLEHGSNFLLCFEKIIAMAHKTVTGSQTGDGVSDDATELVKTAIEHIKSNKEQHSPDDFIDVSPFPEAGLKQVSRRLWQIMAQCPIMAEKTARPPPTLPLQKSI